MRTPPALTTLAMALIAIPIAASAAPVKVVTTLSAYAAIAKEVGGDRVTTESIARGDEDAHFVKPKPSYALNLKDADLFVTTGLDLELWAPVLVDKSGNSKIRDGQPGYVAAAPGVHLVDVPTSSSRSAGDIHIYGNPHIFTSPIESKTVAANIAAGMKRVDPAGAAAYDAGLAAFQKRIDESMYGAQLPGLIPVATLDDLARQGKLIDFLRAQKLEGKPLIDRLGGWLGKALPVYGKPVVTYHSNWSYLTRLLGLEVVGYVEPKPGIPPSARHVHELVQLMSGRGVKVLIAASYFDPKEPRAIADRTGCVPVTLPLGSGVEGIDGYFQLVDYWVDSIVAGFAAAGS